MDFFADTCRHHSEALRFPRACQLCVIVYCPHYRVTYHRLLPKNTAVQGLIKGDRDLNTKPHKCNSGWRITELNANDHVKQKRQRKAVKRAVSQSLTYKALHHWQCTAIRRPYKTSRYAQYYRLHDLVVKSKQENNTSNTTFFTRREAET